MARILIIDDDAGMRTMLRETLTTAGYDVVEAAGGRQGLELHGIQPADVILMDIYMPVQDGIETTTQFQHQFPEAKIIAMSGGTLRSNLLAIVERIGAVRTLQKPFQPEEILAMIKEVLNPL